MGVYTEHKGQSISLEGGGGVKGRLLLGFFFLGGDIIQQI